jgi:hypothetical protein
MKIIKTATVIFFAALSLGVAAQTAIPEGYKKGSILLPDSSTISGFIKDKLKTNGSFCYLNEKGEGRTEYNSSSVLAVTMEELHYVSMKGDFFKLLADGNALCFLQKASNASGNPVFNGTETIYFNGSEGKPGDYFIYNKKTIEMKRVTKKTYNAVTAEIFAGSVAALDKAKAGSNDFTLLKDAVDIFNRN